MTDGQVRGVGVGSERRQFCAQIGSRVFPGSLRNGLGIDGNQYPTRRRGPPMKSTAAVLFAFALVLALVAVPWSATAQDQDPEAQITALKAEVALRDSLIQQQDSLLNTYRCLFDTDTQVVPGGCVDTDQGSDLPWLESQTLRLCRAVVWTASPPGSPAATPRRPRKPSHGRRPTRLTVTGNISRPTMTGPRRPGA